MTLAALLFDLGGTLVQGDALAPHVREALDALPALRTQGGGELALALVSDYTMAKSGDPAEIARLFEEYVAIVRRFGLLDYFTPPTRCVTLSTQAGVRKPDAAIFRLALERLGLAPDLRVAMFVTEDADHVAAARALGMTAWQFQADFTDWRDFPALVADALRGGQEQAFYEALVATDRVSLTGELAPGQTHAIERAPDGRPRVKRKRFSIR